MTSIPRNGGKTSSNEAQGERETGTIARTILVLRAVAQTQQEPTMKELADTINLPMSTMHRLLDLLMQEGMVERDDTTRTFRPGLEFYRLGALVANRMPLQEVARPFLEGAAREAGESSYLGLLDARALKLLFVMGVESGQILDYRIPLNVPYALSYGASGLAALAWLGDEEIERVIVEEGADDKRDDESVRQALAEIREQGYAHTTGQRIPGAVGTFAPIFDGRDRIVGTLGYTVPESRFQKIDRRRLAGLAVHYAGELSKALGYMGPWPRQASSYQRGRKKDIP